MSSTGPGPNAEVDEGELKRRTEFLKAQRDKLLAMKKEEREKQLAEAEQQSVSFFPIFAGQGLHPLHSRGLDPLKTEDLEHLFYDIEKVLPFTDLFREKVPGSFM